MNTFGKNVLKDAVQKARNSAVPGCLCNGQGQCSACEKAALFQALQQAKAAHNGAAALCSVLLARLGGIAELTEEECSAADGSQVAGRKNQLTGRVTLLLVPPGKTIEQVLAEREAAEKPQEEAPCPSGEPESAASP